MGLIVSMAFAIFTGCYIAQQYSVRNENPDREYIYTFGTPEYVGATFAFNDEIIGRLPEIEIAAKYSTDIEGMATIKGEEVSVSISAMDKEFFRIFPYYRFLSGSPEVLESRTAVVISESFARAHGVEVGETIFINGFENVVSGVVEDFKRTLFKYSDLIVSPLNTVNEYSWSSPYDHFGTVIPFVKVRKGTNRAEFAAKVDDICREIYPGVYGTLMFENSREYRLDELFFDDSDYSQLNRGDLKSLLVLSLVALLVLVSAVFNYVNLSFALSCKRAKEMAVRRLNGAAGYAVFFRYISESVLFTFVCVIVSVLLAIWFTPAMNGFISDPDIPVTINLSPVYVLSFILFAVAVGGLAGLFPAVVTCRFRPIDIVSGNLRRRSKMVFSKVFIILQNALAVFLIGIAVVMEAQYYMSLHRPVNTDIDGKYILMQRSSIAQFQLRDRLEALPCVKSIGMVRGAPGITASGQYSVTRFGEEIMYRLCRMDSTAFAMLKPEIIEDFHAPVYNSVWFSETAWTKSGFDDENHDISVLSRRTSGCKQVAGVIRDFPVATSNMEADYPVIVSVERSEDFRYGGWLMDVEGNLKEAQEQIRSVYAEWSEEVYGTYSTPYYDTYLTDNFIEGLRPERNNMCLIEVFMVLAVLISFLGLVAMSSCYARENAGTVAIRKVFGGTVATETGRNLRGYMLLVLVACVIGLPFAVWADARYLQEFVYRLESWWWIPVLGLCFTLAISFLAVLWQTLSSARTNPIDVLRKE